MLFLLIFMYLDQLNYLLFYYIHIRDQRIYEHQNKNVIKSAQYQCFQYYLLLVNRWVTNIHLIWKINFLLAILLFPKIFQIIFTNIMIYRPSMNI